jgi:hypothetical protein
VTAELMWRMPLQPAPTRGNQLSATATADGRTIAWWSDWESGPMVHLVDATTGRELHRELCAATSDVHPAGTGFIAFDHGWRPGATAQRRLVALLRRDDRIDVTAHEVAPRTWMVGAGPEGDQVVLFADGVSALHSWPDMRLRTTWEGYAAGVDFHAGYVWATQDNELRLAALDGSWTRSMPAARWWRVDAVGDGVVRTGPHGIRLFRPQGPILTVLPPTSRCLWDVSVTGGGQVVRAVLGGKLRLFRIDLDTPRVIDAPDDAAYLARAPEFTGRPLAWHPTTDLVALVRRWPRTAVWSAAEGFLCRLPDGSRPHLWLGTGRTLLTSRHDGSTTYLERWSLLSP